MFESIVVTRHIALGSSPQAWGTLTEVAIYTSEELRGKELTIEQVRKYALPARTYVCKEVK